MIGPELAAQRLGMLTASMAGVIMGGLKTDGLAKYVRRLAGERVFGDLGEESFRSVWMARGDETENQALDWYEFEHDVTLIRQAHTVHAQIPFVAATPDGLLPGQYTAEGKCQLFHVWCETNDAVRARKHGLDAVPSEYRWQCRWQPWTCGLTDGRYIAYHPVGGGQGIVVPYQITASEIEQMTERAFLVNEMVREQEAQLRDRRRAA